MIKKWEDAYALRSHGTVFRQRFDGIEPVGEYMCLVVYYSSQIKGYLPPSEVGISEPTERDIQVLLGYPVPVVVQDVVRDENVVVLSRRIAMTRLARQFWENARAGQEVEGVLLTLARPGTPLQVDLGGALATVPPDEITWLNWVDPGELRRRFPQFEPVRVKIVSLDPESGAVTASIKALQENPWEKIIPERYAPGSIHRGMITGENHTGAFVKFSDGVTCLCDKKTFRGIPIEPGVSVVVKIRSLNYKRRRVNGKVLPLGRV